MLPLGEDELGDYVTVGIRMNNTEFGKLREKKSCLLVQYIYHIHTLYVCIHVYLCMHVCVHVHVEPKARILFTLCFETVSLTNL